MADRFWERKPLWAFSAAEWESVCDGCAKCCLVKLEDEAEPETVYFTDVACRLLDLETCRCTDYAERTRRVPGCIALAPAKLDQLGLMPPSCAYRRLAEGRGLPAWHHLLTGNHRTIDDAGHSIRGRVVSETSIDANDLEDRLVDWPLDEG